jgi:hypothetical protein
MTSTKKPANRMMTEREEREAREKWGKGYTAMNGVAMNMMYPKIFANLTGALSDEDEASFEKWKEYFPYQAFIHIMQPQQWFLQGHAEVLCDFALEWMGDFVRGVRCGELPKAVDLKINKYFDKYEAVLDAKIHAANSTECSCCLTQREASALLSCSRCQKAFYCNDACQVLLWNVLYMI